MRLQDAHEALEATLREAAGALQDGDVEFMLGGSMASWARGGPLSRKDVDLYVRPDDAGAARPDRAISDAGLESAPRRLSPPLRSAPA